MQRGTTFQRLSVGNTHLGVRQLPAPQKAVPKFITRAPTRQLDPKSLYNGIKQDVDMNVTLGAHKSEMDVNPSPDFIMDYQSFFKKNTAVNYHSGELIWKVTDLETETPEDHKYTKVVGLSELITLFEEKEKTPTQPIHRHKLAFEFLGVYLNNRTVEAGLPHMQRVRTSQATMSIEGLNNILPYWGKNVRQQGKLFLFILQARPAVAALALPHIGEFRVYPFVHNGDDLDGARDAFVEELMKIAHHAAFIDDAAAIAAAQHAAIRGAPVAHAANQLVIRGGVRHAVPTLDAIAAATAIRVAVPGLGVDAIHAAQHAAGGLGATVANVLRDTEIAVVIAVQTALTPANVCGALNISALGNIFGLPLGRDIDHIILDAEALIRDTVRQLPLIMQVVAEVKVRIAGDIPQLGLIFNVGQNDIAACIHAADVEAARIIDAIAGPMILNNDPAVDIEAAITGVIPAAGAVNMFNATMGRPTGQDIRNAACQDVEAAVRASVRVVEMVHAAAVPGAIGAAIPHTAPAIAAAVARDAADVNGFIIAAESTAIATINRTVLDEVVVAITAAVPAAGPAAMIARAGIAPNLAVVIGAATFQAAAAVRAAPLAPPVAAVFADVIAAIDGAIPFAGFPGVAAAANAAAAAAGASVAHVVDAVNNTLRALVVGDDAIFKKKRETERATRYTSQIVYAASIGRIRADRMDRTRTMINLTADVPGYDIDFLRKPTSCLIPVTIDNMKMEYTRYGNAYYKCPMYTRFHLPYQRKTGGGLLVLTPRHPPPGRFGVPAPVPPPGAPALPFDNTHRQREPMHVEFARRAVGFISDESSEEEGSGEDESEIGFQLYEHAAGEEAGPAEEFAEEEEEEEEEEPARPAHHVKGLVQGKAEARHPTSEDELDLTTGQVLVPPKQSRRGRQS